jgi:hypothetical protein
MDYIFTVMAIILAFLYLGLNFVRKNIIKKNTVNCNSCSGCGKICKMKD